MKRIHMTFVGGGSKEGEIKKMVNDFDLGEYVTFTGRRNDVPEILKTMDVFIMPSTVEGLPMSAIEAMRSGLFLILIDAGGNKELCEDGCGFVCTREPTNIKEIMCDVLDNAVISNEQKVRSNQRFLDRFSLSSMAKGYEETINML